MTRRRHERNGVKVDLWLNVRMTEEMYEMVTEASERAGLARGAWVRELIEDVLGCRQ